MQPADRFEALAFLRRVTADDQVDLRPGQWEAIDALVNRRQRLLVVQRTGWGKSAVYFIATRMLRDRSRGFTLIVSPLLALMRNQLEGAGRLGLNARTINSANDEEWGAVHADLAAGRVDALLISPERLANDDFAKRVLAPLAQQLGLLVVDEAHCISDWGHDFRPDYRRLVNILKRMPRGLPVLATTATASNRVVDDIVSQLGQIEVQRGPLMRTSLRLGTLRLPDAAVRLAWLAHWIPRFKGAGIVYVLTKRDAMLVASWLREVGIEALPYFSGVSGGDHPDGDGYREQLEQRLLNNDLKVLVATTALGMGFDKPDLGFVIHYQAPGSVVAYYQQVGRAGRAIDCAWGILLAGAEDDEIHRFFRRSAFPDEAHIRQVLDALAAADGLTIREIESAVNIRYGQIEHALKFLSVENPAPVICQAGRWMRTPIPYTLDRSHVDRLTAQREMEWEEIQNYIDSRTCLMRFLAERLNDPLAADCGQCSVCRQRPLDPTCIEADLIRRAQRTLCQAEVELPLNRQAPPGAIAIDGLSGRIPLNLRAETGRVLAHWGEPGWGRLVAEGKHSGHFSDELVEGAAAMVEERWKPQPPPAWATCVPSLRHPTLNPDFSRRLASRLGVPFVPAVRKVRDNPAQKLQQNRYHQCANLDGAFRIEGPVRDSPVLLIDDVVDSGWTMTIVAALLRRAGSGPVLPLALATAGPGD